MLTTAWFSNSVEISGFTGRKLIRLKLLRYSPFRVRSAEECYRMANFPPNSGGGVTLDEVRGEYSAFPTARLIYRSASDNSELPDRWSRMCRRNWARALRGFARPKLPGWLRPEVCN